MIDQLHSKILRPLIKLVTLDPIRNPSPKVAVLRLQGVIGQGGRMRGKGLTLEDYGDAIKDAFNASGIKAVALFINSPGGSPVQSALLYDAIRYYAEEKDVPVLGFTEDVCASGGYWLGMAADELYAHPSSIVGSIGVVASGFGLVDFIERHGIQRRVYTQGENKAMLDPFLPEKQEDINRLLSVQRDVHESFKELVISHRQKKLNADGDELFSGAFWSGNQAYDMGLVDGLGSAGTILREKFGSKVKLVEFKPKKPLLGGLLSAAIDGSSLPEATLNMVEERSHWQRFGL